MKRNLRPWAYLAVALALVGLSVLTPHAWATPANQGTVPTATRPGRSTATAIVPTARPTSAPVTTPQSQPSPTSQPSSPRRTDPVPPPAQATQQPPLILEPTVTPGGPSVTPAPTSTRLAVPGRLNLVVIARPPMAWPGATLQLTVTLSNPGSEAIEHIVLTNTLSTGLAPGSLPMGSTGTWQGQALRFDVPRLGPNEQVDLPFSVTVERDNQAGVVLQLVSAASTGDEGLAWVQTLLPMPPSELPTTGADFRFLRPRGQAGAFTGSFMDGYTCPSLAGRCRGSR